MRLREIEPREAHAEMQANPAIVYVDVRSEREFEQGHPAGAWNIPILHAGMMGMRPNPEFLEVATRVLPKGVPLIIGCRSGQRSASACQVLAQAGFDDLANVAGGFLGGHGIPGWSQCGLPSATEPEPGKSWAELRAGG
jgi:rhodanese-related sulfurtransferase